MPATTSRNAPCPCGSGKKFKQCCIRARAATSAGRLLPSTTPKTRGSLRFTPRLPAAKPANSTPIDRRDWQEVQVVYNDPTDKMVLLVVLYSRQWLQSRNVTVGGAIALDIPKYRIRGEGQVQTICPSKSVPQGEGLVVSCVHLKPEPTEIVLPPVKEREWQQLHIRVDEAGGWYVYLVLLHSREWMQLNGIADRGTVFLNLPERGVHGEGRVTLIEPSPIRADGEGRVMTFVRTNRKPPANTESLTSRSAIRTYFGERLPPLGQEWLQLIFARDGDLKSDLLLTRSTEWMQANWNILEALDSETEQPADVADWRLVHISVNVQDGQKVHISTFWSKKEVTAYALIVGEPVLLRLPKEHLSGEGTITAIEPAPFVPYGDQQHGMMFISGKNGGPGKGTIDTTEVGDYVTTYTHAERGDRLPIDNTQGKWVARQRVRLHLDKEDGGHSKIVFLRDATWIRAENAVIGGTIYLDMPDMGCVGHARVDAIEPCLVFLRWGNSSIQMVTGTFAHSEGWCGELKLNGESKPFGVTPKHPIWSEDRQDWVPAGDLVPGETVKTLKGTTTVESYTMCDKPEPTFNMEVEGDHVYRVGEQGVLVHNSSNPCDTLCQKDGVPDPGLPDPKPVVEFYAELYMKDNIPIGTGAASKFTSGETGQIVKIIALNRKRNGGVVKSDDPTDPFQVLRSGPEDLYREEIAAGTVRWEDERMRFLVWVADGRRVSLVTLPGPTTGNERRGRQVAVVDHVRPKDGGGSNSYCNARVISKALNSIKGNR